MAGAGGTINKSTINGNDNADVITAVIESGSNSSFIAAGKGKDTVNLTFSGANAFTINGGAGHDAIDLTAVGSLSSFIINGGKGKDSITFSGGAVAGLRSNSKLDGGDQADLITFTRTPMLHSLLVAQRLLVAQAQTPFSSLRVST